MGKETIKRRLTAILAADVVGYSRLMADDEAGTLASLKALRRELFEPKAAEYHGRLVKLMGDGTLMEFASVVDAVNFAVDIQGSIRKLNTAVPPERRITFRIGINVGDVIVETDDIYGDGVNVAARLESLADPGGILVSGSVHDYVEGKIDVQFENLGEKAVKNIPKKVRVFKILPAVPAAETVGLTSRNSAGAWKLIAAGLAIVMVFAGASWWQWTMKPREVVFSQSNPAPLSSSKPSIAVLPFVNLSPDPEQEYFADGMSEDLITDLSKISGLFVISRNSTFAYKGKSVDVREVAKELGVRYVLEGSVRRVGTEVRINAQLIEAETGGHLWAERFDGGLANIFDLQDRVAQQIINALALELTPREAKLISDPGTQNPDAHDAYLLGLSHYFRRTPDEYFQAVIQFKRAIEMDPGYALAHLAIAKIYAQVDDLTYSRALKINLSEAAGAAWVALSDAGDYPSADKHIVRSWLYLDKRQHDRAIAEAEQALAINPNDADALEALALAKIYNGEAEAGMRLADRVIRQDPVQAARPMMLKGLAEFVMGNFGRSIDYIERGYRLGSEDTLYAGILAAANALIDKTSEAVVALDKFARGFGEKPDLAKSVFAFAFANQEDLQRLAAGLQAAGVKVWFTPSDGGYLPLDRGNQLSDEEIGRVLSGGKIEGKNFWFSDRWQRFGTADGPVSYHGHLVHPGVGSGLEGTSRIDKGMVCERWPNASGTIEFCSLIFRLPGDNARKRWADFILMTDLGPFPFTPAN